MKDTTVTIDPETAKVLDRLTKANGVSKKEFLRCALAYFEQYGINPVNHESPAQEMQKLIKRLDQVVGFIRTQEKEILRPMCEAVSLSESRINQTLSNLATVPQLQALNKSVQEIGQKQSRESYQLKEDVKFLLTRQSNEEREALRYLGNLIDAKQKTSFLDDLNKVYQRSK